MRTRSLAVIALVGLFVVPTAAQSQAPIQISLFPPAQIVPETDAVSGLRLGIYAKNAAMTGLDLGVVMHSTGDATAFQISAVNIVDGDFTGAQVGWGIGASLANVTRGYMQGFQLGVYNGAGTAQGFQWGAVNNVDRRMQGFQLSLVNIAEDMHGLQVGLINIIRSKDRFPVLPIVNWKFD